MPTKKKNTPKPVKGAATGARREVDDDHIYLLACIEIGGGPLDFGLIGAAWGMSKDAARMKYARLRRRIYDATTPAPAPETNTGPGKDGDGHEKEKTHEEGENEQDDDEQGDK